MIALLIVASIIGSRVDSCTASQGERVDLVVGDSAIRTIDPRAPRNFTGIVLHRGTTYAMHVAGKWRDSRLDSVTAKGAAIGTLKGFPAFWLAPGPLVRRKRWGRWMQMIGEVPAGSGHLFRIGEGRDVWQSDRDGELVAFANDVNFRWSYANNLGCVHLTVRRIR